MVSSPAAIHVHVHRHGLFPAHTTLVVGAVHYCRDEIVKSTRVPEEDFSFPTEAGDTKKYLVQGTASQHASKFFERTGLPLVQMLEYGRLNVVPIGHCVSSRWAELSVYVSSCHHAVSTVTTSSSSCPGDTSRSILTFEDMAPPLIHIPITAERFN